MARCEAKPGCSFVIHSHFSCTQEQSSIISWSCLWSLSPTHSPITTHTRLPEHHQIESVSSFTRCRLLPVKNNNILPFHCMTFHCGIIVTHSGSEYCNSGFTRYEAVTSQSMWQWHTKGVVSVNNLQSYWVSQNSNESEVTNFAPYLVTTFGKAHRHQLQLCPAALAKVPALSLLEAAQGAVTQASAKHCCLLHSKPLPEEKPSPCQLACTNPVYLACSVIFPAINSTLPLWQLLPYIK